MSERVPLPENLRDRSFRYHDARQQGVGEGRLRNVELARPFRGIRAQPPEANAPANELARKRCLDFLPLLGHGQFLSNVSAAAIWGIPLPPSALEDPTVHVTAIRPAIAPRMVGVTGHHVASARVVKRLDLPVSDATTTWLSLGTILGHEDLVAAGDYLVLNPAVLDPNDLRPFVTLSSLVDAARRFRGRGAAALHAAAGDLRQGAESRPESLLRLLIARAGLPEPELNVDIADRDGKWIGRADLVWRQFRVIVEYDGDQHRTNTLQYEKDVRRIDRFFDCGFRVVRVRSRGLFREPGDTVARVASALRAGGWVRDSSYRRSQRRERR